MDAYDEGWKAFEEGKKLTDNPYSKLKANHLDYHRRASWEYGFYTRQEIKKARGV